MIKISIRDREEVFELLKQEDEKSLNSYNLLLEDSVDNLWKWYLDDNMIYIFVKEHSRLKQSIGQELFSLEEWKSRIHPHDRESAERIWKEFLHQSKDKYENLYRLENAPGEYRWLLSKGRSVKTSSNEVDYVVGYHVDVTEKHILKEELYLLSYYDKLTRLSNKEKLKRDFELMCEQMSTGVEIAFLQFDIDNFGYINNTLGHEIGHNLIINFAEFLASRYRIKNPIARINEDEFLVAYQYSGGRVALEQELVEVLRLIKSERFVANSEIRISCSIGVSLYGEQGKDFYDLTRKSSTALYCAKKNSKDQYMIYSKQLGASVYYNIEMINQIRVGLEEKAFEMFYQPIVNLKTGEIASLEALIRWNHEDQGFISPDVFIPIAEDSGQIIPLEKWVFENVFMQIQKWVNADKKEIKFSINMSAKGLVTADIISFLELLLEKYQIDPSMVEFEVTETAVFNNIEYTLAVLEKLKRLGFRLALDDFGVGYSSLSYLSILPIEKVKLDRKFISNMERSKRDYLLVKSIIDTAHNLDLEIVAEGIENNDQVEMLSALNCDYIQGYHCGKPQCVELTSKIIPKKS